MNKISIYAFFLSSYWSTKQALIYQSLLWDHSYKIGWVNWSGSLGIAPTFLKLDSWVLFTKGINQINNGNYRGKRFMHTKRFKSFLKIWVQFRVVAIPRLPIGLNGPLCFYKSIGRKNFPTPAWVRAWVCAPRALHIYRRERRSPLYNR